MNCSWTETKGCACSQLYQRVFNELQRRKAEANFSKPSRLACRHQILSHLSYTDAKGISFLPEGNAITIPAYVIHRDPRYFSPNPNFFIPERWLPPCIPSEAGTNNGSAIEFQTARDAFIPFSVGPQNCAGRPLALIEMRYLLAVLMRNFDMEFDRQVYTDTQWEDKMEDRFTFQAKGVLPVMLKWRGPATKIGSATS